MQKMEDDPKKVSKVRGTVKWFDPLKGFGFVEADDGGPAILLHANVLRNFGHASVADAAGIRVIVQETARGIQAVEVLEIEPPQADESLAIEGEVAVPLDTTLPLEPARVKWFDKAKGFGFANVFGRDEDVFLHIEVLRRSGLSDLQPGEAVSLRVVDGKRGRMAVQIASFEGALDQHPSTPSYEDRSPENEKLAQAIAAITQLNSSLEEQHRAFNERREERIRRLSE